MPSKRPGRPRGPNYQANIKRQIRRLTNSGYLSTDAAEQQTAIATVKSDPSGPVVSQAIEFLKAIKATGAHRQLWNQTVKVGDHEVVLDDGSNRLMADGVMYRLPWRLRYQDIRQVALSSTLVGAIHQVYVDDARMHGSFGTPGFEWTTKDESKRMKPEMDKRARELGNLVEQMGDKTLADWRSRDGLEDVLEMATRDTLTIDRVAYLLQRNRKGRVIDCRYLDPSTVFQTDPRKGYRGDKRIGYVQCVNGEVVEVFQHDEMVLRSRNRLSDVRYRYDGWSPLESCMYEAMGGIYALRHNMDKFNGRNPPKILMSSKTHVHEEIRELFEEIWQDAYGSDGMNFRIPLVHGVEDLQVHNLNTESDMLYDRFMQWTVSMLLARHGMDEAELGLKMASSGALSEPQIEGRARFSRNRRHGAIMRFHERCLRDIWEEEDDILRIAFTGVRTDDEAKVLENRVKRLNSFASLDEIRAEEDQPSYGEMALKYLPKDATEDMKSKVKLLGTLIPNPQFLQAWMAIVNGGQGGEEAGGFGDGFDGGGFVDGQQFSENNDFSETTEEV